jgi:hypothetical protein
MWLERRAASSPRGLLPALSEGGDSHEDWQERRDGDRDATQTLGKA